MFRTFFYGLMTLVATMATANAACEEYESFGITQGTFWCVEVEDQGVDTGTYRFVYELGAGTICDDDGCMPMCDLFVSQDDGACR